MSPAAVTPARMVVSDETSAVRTLSVAETASMLGLSESYVRRHKRDLHALALPGVVRFSRSHVEALATASDVSVQPASPPSPALEPKRAAAKRRRTGTSINLLPIEDDPRA